MSPPCTFTAEDPYDADLEDGVIQRWRVTHAKSGDALVVRIHEILHDTSHDLGVDPGLIKDGVEADLQRLLAEQVALVGEGLTLVRREYPTAIGPVALLLRDPAGGTLAVELERSEDIDGARSEEHTSELQSLMRYSIAVFFLK